MVIKKLRLAASTIYTIVWKISVLRFSGTPHASKCCLDRETLMIIFRCNNYCRISDSFFLSTFSGASCIKCGTLMDREVKLEVNDSRDEVTHCHGDGVFVKGGAMYLIFADLKVIQSSPRTVAKELFQLGHKDFNNLTELDRNFGLKQRASTSKSPLSDLFFVNSLSEGMSTFSPEIGQPNTHNWSNYRSIKVSVSKSKKKILNDEAEEDLLIFH
ncbi:hypothetical protein PIB30_059197 [Stylosanthes scabra]|uniref:Uncharacterized protein n=1 Tax=Stylosanthes scabra TaxID=79078 RepID=A0ABU6XKD1_9FABA|nr:hypothetical protein [Stylosanthes scabra]